MSFDDMIYTGEEERKRGKGKDLEGKRQQK